MSKAIRKRASWWLVRLQSEEGSQADRARFRAWLAADPRHRAAFEEINAALEDVRALGRADPDLLQSIPTLKPRSVERRQVVIAGGVMALAAALVLGVVWLQQPEGRRYATNVGGHRVAALDDGSIVELNTDTELDVRFTDTRRSVRLVRGEALFQVVHDRTRPFDVEADEHKVRTVGTRFVVRLDQRALKVTVTEGVVEIRPRAFAALTERRNGPPQRLRRGERYDAVGTRAILSRVSDEELSRELAWRQGMLRFDGAPLIEVVTEVSRYTGARFSIEDPTLEQLRVVAYLRATNLDGFLDGLSENFPELRIARSGQEVRIARRKGEQR